MSRQEGREPVLILCSPRSCSTVACAMLGAHPELYGFPELNLFVTESVGELRAIHAASAGVSYMSGVLRAVAELEFEGQAGEALRLADAWISERSDWSSRRMFDHLLARVHPRAGVDKSPRTALSRRSIERALGAYPGARVVHLTRHPIATVRSLVANHMRSAPDLLSSAEPAWLAGFYALLWVESQELILSAVERWPAEQAARMRSDELLRRPDVELARLAEWLGVRTDAQTLEAMKHPERWPYARPATGVDGEGDPGFMRSPALRTSSDPASLLIPPEWDLGPRLLARIDGLARCLGYGPIS